MMINLAPTAGGNEIRSSFVPDTVAHLEYDRITTAKSLHSRAVTMKI